jgi:hypothetical protein
MSIRATISITNDPMATTNHTMKKTARPIPTPALSAMVMVPPE